MRLLWLSAALFVGACSLGFNPDLPSGSTNESGADGDEDGGGILSPPGEDVDVPAIDGSRGGAGGAASCDEDQSTEMGGAGSEDPCD